MNKSNKTDLIKLPLKVDLVKSASKNLTYTGIYPASFFERLSELVVSINSEISANLEFGVDHQKKSFLKGEARLTITQCCQRCNENFNNEVKVKFLLSPVKDLSQMSTLPEEYDHIVIDEWGEADVLHAVEDEFLLALPISPMHESEECVVSDTIRTFGVIEEGQPKENPFAVLVQLKKDK